MRPNVFRIAAAFVFGIALSLLTASCDDLPEANFIEVETGTHTISEFDASGTYITAVALTGGVTGLAEGSELSDVGHLWSTTAGEVAAGRGIPTNLGRRIGNGEIVSSLRDLLPNTTYYYRAYAVHEGELFLGETTGSFATSMLDFTVVLDSVEKYTTSILPFAHIEGLAPGIKLTNHGFVWSTTLSEPTLEDANEVSIGQLQGSLQFDRTIEGIQGEWPQKTYHVRAFAQLGTEIEYSNTVHFKKGDVWVCRGKIANPTSGGFAFTYDGAAYIGGGGHSLTFRKYVPADTDCTTTLNLESLPSLQKTVDRGTSFTLSIAGQGYGYVGAGATASVKNELYLYDIAAKIWTKLDTGPGRGAPLYSHARGLTVNNVGYVVAGTELINGGIGQSRDVYRFRAIPSDPLFPFQADPKKLSREEFIFFNRYQLIAFSLDGELYAGLDGGPTADNDLWRYSEKEKRWVRRADLPDPGFHAGDLHAFSIGHRGFVITNDQENNFWEYNARRDKWTARKDFAAHPRRSSAVVFSLNDTGFYGMGSSEGSILNDLWQYIPEEAQ